MLDQAAAAIATGAAGNIVAYMLNGQVDVRRTRLARIFRHSPEPDRSAALQKLDTDIVALADEGKSRSELTAEWANLLYFVIANHPQARSDVESLASNVAVNSITNIGSQHNHGSGTFVAGDNHGNIISGRDGK